MKNHLDGFIFHPSPFIRLVLFLRKALTFLRGYITYPHWVEEREEIFLHYSGSRLGGVHLTSALCPLP
jgi:hypothetical protein